LKAKAYGFEAYSPLDNEIDPDGKNIIPTIFNLNMKDIDNADVVVANIEPFRGCCVDDGTSFELGVAYAKGKRLLMYMPEAKMSQRARLRREFAKHGEFLKEDEYPLVEDFNGANPEKTPGAITSGPVNLMLTQAARNSGGSEREANGEPNIFTSYEEVLEYLARETAAAAPGTLRTTVASSTTYAAAIPRETGAVPVHTGTAPSICTADAPVKTVVPPVVKAAVKHGSVVTYSAHVKPTVAAPMACSAPATPKSFVAAPTSYALPITYSAPTRYTTSATTTHAAPATSAIRMAGSVSHRV